MKNRRGVFEYLLGGSTDTTLLDIRVLDEVTKRSVYETQSRKAAANKVSNCPHCVLGHDATKDKIWPLSDMDADHVSAWSKGGGTHIKNCQLLCKTPHRAKGKR